MYHNPKAYEIVPLGIVLQRRPGVTPWLQFTWRASSVLPGAGPAAWHQLRREGDVVEFHADTLSLELHGAEAEAYHHNLGTQVPCVYVVMRPGEGAAPLDLMLVTASPYEAQDYADTGEEIVEKVAMPPSLLALVQDFVDRFYEDQEFIKRKRDKKRVDLVQDGVGDPRVQKAADIFASPAQIRSRLQ